jgi:hypothetical protein
MLTQYLLRNRSRKMVKGMMKEMKSNAERNNRFAEGLSGATCSDAKTVGTWATNTWGEGLNKQLNDVCQGCVNDCFVLAVFGAIVAVDPSRLKGNATSGYYFLPVGTTTEKKITIDKKLAVTSANSPTDFVYARWSGDNTRKFLWPMLWEKAYAKFLDQTNKYPDPKDPTQPNISKILDGGDVKKAMKEIGRYKTFVEGDFSFTSGNPNFPSVAATSGSPPGGFRANHTYSVIKKYDNGGYQLRDQCGSTFKDLAGSDLTTAKFATWGYGKDPV